MKKAIEITPDGPDGLDISVRTTDADPHLAEERARVDVELQKRLDAIRAAGDPRPVAFLLFYGSLAADRLRMLLPAGFSQENLLGTVHVVRREVARPLLKPVLRSMKASQLFRVFRDDWPVGYWTVHLAGDTVQIYQSRTWKDAEEQGAA